MSITLASAHVALHADITLRCSIRVVFDAPGFLSGLLDSKRPTALLCRTMRILTHLGQCELELATSLWQLALTITICRRQRLEHARCLSAREGAQTSSAASRCPVADAALRGAGRTSRR